MAVLHRWTARYPLVSFFLLTFAWSWLVWVPLALVQAGQPVTNIPLVLAVVLLGACGPNMVAIILTALSGGKQGVGALLRRLLIWRVSARWYAVLLLPPALWIVTSLVYALVSGAAPVLTGPWYLFIFAMLSAILTGPIAEEIGWRGYALPRLQQRFSALQSGAVLGVIWAVCTRRCSGYLGSPLPLPKRAIRLRCCAIS